MLLSVVSAELGWLASILLSCWAAGSSHSVMLLVLLVGLRGDGGGGGYVNPVVPENR